MARKLGNWIHSFRQYTKNLESPDAFHYWTAVSTVAGALGGKVWFDMGHFKWKPNFFIIFVAPPGIAAKSTTASQGMQILAEVPGAHIGPSSVTWQALTQSFAEHAEQIPMPNGDYLPMSCITVSALEMGTFLDPTNREMMDVLVDLWDGHPRPWVRKTKGGGEEIIPNPWFNMIAATTPSWIAGNMPEYAIGGGFTSRSLFVYASRKRHLYPYPGRDMPKDSPALYAALIEDLIKISELKGEFIMDEDAYMLGTAWYLEHWTNPPSTLRDPRFEGYLSRKQAHVHKLAMVLSASEREDLVITKPILAEAIRMVTSLEPDMIKVYSQVTSSSEAKHTLRVEQVLKMGSSRIQKNVLFASMRGSMGYEEFDRALTAMVQAGLAELQQIGSEIFIIPHSSLLEDTTAESPNTTAGTSSRPEAHAQVIDLLSRAGKRFDEG